MIHPTAVIDEGVIINPTATIWAHAVVRRGSMIGRDVVIGSNCYIGEGCVIQDGTRIQHGVFLPNASWLGKNVFIGPNATFTDDKLPYAGNSSYKAEPPRLGDNVSVGAGAVILPGVALEDGCMVGAGAVVTKRVPTGVTVIGNPAQTIQDYKKADFALRKISRWVDTLLREWVQ